MLAAQLLAYTALLCSSQAGGPLTATLPHALACVHPWVCTLHSPTCKTRAPSCPPQGNLLKIRRPTDYNPAEARKLGPCEASPHVQLGLLR